MVSINQTLMLSQVYADDESGQNSIKNDSAKATKTLDETKQQEEELSNHEQGVDKKTHEARKAELKTKEYEKLRDRELGAIENSKELLLQIQKANQTQPRLDSLLKKLESGIYYGTTNSTEPQKSYSLSFEGSVSSIDALTITDISGEIFLQTTQSGQDVTKFKVTGGSIFVDDLFYDLIFGKARYISSENDNSNSMIIIGELYDERGEFHTLSITLDAESDLESISELEPMRADIKIPQSKISGHWLFSATGNIYAISD